MLGCLPPLDIANLSHSTTKCGRWATLAFSLPAFVATAQPGDAGIGDVLDAQTRTTAAEQQAQGRVDSVNAATAAALLLFEARRQRASGAVPSTPSGRAETAP